LFEVDIEGVGGGEEVEVAASVPHVRRALAESEAGR
jgi:hypothetical protein